MARSSKIIISYNGRSTPKCGHSLSMKMFVSKSDANPGRKYWKCRFWGKEEVCQLFYWDDKYFGSIDRKRIEEGDDGCSRCNVMIEHLRKFGKYFRKEFGRGFGTKPCSKEMEEMRNKLENTRKKLAFVVVVLICSWVYFVIV
ncbi:unnamed protein product [Lathyrus sativus]|nr:unnamed protein product [Lathyrus sativus]